MLCLTFLSFLIHSWIYSFENIVNYLCIVYTADLQIDEFIFLWKHDFSIFDSLTDLDEPNNSFLGIYKNIKIAELLT